MIITNISICIFEEKSTFHVFSKDINAFIFDRRMVYLESQCRRSEQWQWRVPWSCPAGCRECRGRQTRQWWWVRRAPPRRNPWPPAARHSPQRRRSRTRSKWTAKTDEEWSVSIVEVFWSLRDIFKENFFLFCLKLSKLYARIVFRGGKLQKRWKYVQQKSIYNTYINFDIVESDDIVEVKR